MRPGACTPQLERENPHATTKEKPTYHNKEPTCHNERSRTPQGRPCVPKLRPRCSQKNKRRRRRRMNIVSKGQGWETPKEKTGTRGGQGTELPSLALWLHCSQPCLCHNPWQVTWHGTSLGIAGALRSSQGANEFQPFLHASRKRIGIQVREEDAKALLFYRYIYEHKLYTTSKV